MTNRSTNKKFFVDDAHILCSKWETSPLVIKMSSAFCLRLHNDVFCLAGKRIADFAIFLANCSKIVCYLQKNWSVSDWSFSAIYEVTGWDGAKNCWFFQQLYIIIPVCAILLPCYTVNGLKKYKDSTIIRTACRKKCGVFSRFWMIQDLFRHIIKCPLILQLHRSKYYRPRK